MTKMELFDKGYKLLPWRGDFVKPYNLQRGAAGFDYITIAGTAKAEGRYYQAIDEAGNILLVAEKNMAADPVT